MGSDSSPLDTDFTFAMDDRDIELHCYLHLVLRELILTSRTYRASTVRILRLTTNSLLSSLDLVLQTISTFDPSLPQLSDEELAEQRRIANSGNVKGIELRGDGKGAGSGEEIKG